MNTEKKLQWHDVKSIIRRRKKLFIVTFLSILSASIIIAFILPPIYRAETTIFIEEQQIPEHFVQSTVTSYAEERLNSIKQQVLSGERLKEIILERDLYSEIRQKYGIGEAVGKMRDSIELVPESASFVNRATGRSIDAVIAFILYYEGKDPETVKKITNVLGDLFIQEDLRLKEKVTQATTGFLNVELEALKEQLQVYEKKVSEFKQEHFGELPEHSNVNLETIARLERSLDNVEMQIRNLQEKKINLEGQLATVDPLLPITIDGQNVARNPSEQLKYLRLKLISAQAVLHEKHPDIQKLKREIQQLEDQVGINADQQEEIKRLDSLKVDLAALKGRFGPNHPDVVKLTKEIKILEKSVRKKSGSQKVRAAAKESPDNPMYINLMTQIASIDTSIGNLVSDKKSIEQDLAKYRQRIETAPAVEKEYNELTRDYNIMKGKYNELMNSLMTANVSKQMEDAQHGQRFEIKNYAYLPKKPYKPNRVAIILLGFVLASGFGFGLSALREFFDHSIKDETELSALVSVPVLAVIPEAKTQKEKVRKAAGKLIWALAACGFVLLGAKIFNDYVMPLEEVWGLILNNVKKM